MRPDPVRAIADAVLYEGFILWPYRRSALKNQRRFTWGGVYPPEHSRLHPDDRDVMQTEVLVQGPAATEVGVSVRFLHVVHRDVARRRGGGLEPVDELVVDGERHLAWDEAAEREIATAPLRLEQLEAPMQLPIAIAAGRRQEHLAGPTGACEGALIRSWAELRGELDVRAQQLGPELWLLRVRVRNSTPFGPGTRQQALAHTLCSTHAMLRATGGEFVSATDPPADLAGPAEACQNLGSWPVLVGEPPDRSTVLASPIILEDHPRIAPESPGDWFDGGEIDQLLVLNVLSLTDVEKAEMAATDPRAREILERTEALTPEQLMALHGTVREFGMARP